MQGKTIHPSLQLILDIAKKMILEKGCRNTTLQDIAEQSGLTKGAIYHYVKSKDELFAMILELGMEQANQSFFEAVSEAISQKKGIHAPFETISQRLHSLSNSDNVASLIFIYLLSQKGNPAIEKILNRLNETSLKTAKTWIEVGQQHQVISANIDAEKLAKILTIFKNGLQVQSILSPDSDDIGVNDIYKLLLSTLGAKNHSM